MKEQFNFTRIDTATDSSQKALGRKILKIIVAAGLYNTLEALGRRTLENEQFNLMTPYFSCYCSREDHSISTMPFEIAVSILLKIADLTKPADLELQLVKYQRLQPGVPQWLKLQIQDYLGDLDVFLRDFAVLIQSKKNSEYFSPEVLIAYQTKYLNNVDPDEVDNIMKEYEELKFRESSMSPKSEISSLKIQDLPPKNNIVFEGLDEEE